jgi:hypothetical protein
MKLPEGIKKSNRGTQIFGDQQNREKLQFSSDPSEFQRFSKILRHI